MTAILQKASKTYGKKLFEQHLEQYTPVDPLYEQYTDSKGKVKRRKRQLPPGLSKRDAAILKSVKKRAHYLDKGFTILGFRFGWTFFIGLIPLLGSLTDAALNYRLVVVKARKADIPDWLLRKMLLNNAVSAGVSFVPIVGDVVLAAFKANSRNAALLEEFLRIRGEEFLKMGGVPEDRTKKGGGWVKALVGRALGAGVSAKDVEQVKPGAGMTKEEMREAEAGVSLKPGTGGEVAGTSTAVAPLPAATTSKRAEAVKTAPVKQQQQTLTVPTADAAPAGAATHVKKSSGSGSGLSGFFGSLSSRRSSPKPAPPAKGDKGRFVENVSATTTPALTPK